MFDDLAMAEVFEPNLVRAARKVFADSYEYTRMYREYRERRKAEEEVRQRRLAAGGGLGVVTPRGQWDYPGEVTTIPSNRITMQGVPYPVLGVSDTGDVQMMLPG